MIEIWKDVVGYEGLYQVSNCGRVRSVERNVSVQRSGQKYLVHYESKVLIPQERRHGYLSVCLYGRGGNKRNFKQISVHRLVAEAFIPNPKNLSEVNHIDEDKQNNKLENLEWVSHQENCSTPTLRKRHSERQSKHPNFHKTLNQYTKDGKYVATYYSAREAQRKTGVGYSNISSAIKEHRTAGGYYWCFANGDNSDREIAIQKSHHSARERAE